MARKRHPTLNDFISYLSLDPALVPEELGHLPLEGFQGTFFYEIFEEMIDSFLNHPKKKEAVHARS